MPLNSLSFPNWEILQISYFWFYMGRIKNRVFEMIPATQSTNLLSLLVNAIEISTFGGRSSCLVALTQCDSECCPMMAKSMKALRKRGFSLTEFWRKKLQKLKVRVVSAKEQEVCSFLLFCLWCPLQMAQSVSVVVVVVLVMMISWYLDTCRPATAADIRKLPHTFARLKRGPSLGRG